MKIFVLSAILWFASPAAADAGALPLAVTDDDYRSINRSQVELGHLLFWDPILSGNRNISCGTCHHPKFGTSDGVSLSLGEGGVGLGPDRRPDPSNMPEQRIPRNAPALFNLGAHEFTRLFHDGRIEVDPGRKSGLRTPLEDDMASGFATLLSAQTMFPVLSQDEMAGHYSENEISQAVRKGRITGEGGAWDLISQRVADIPEYRAMFKAAFSDVSDGGDIGFTHISDAIAAFMEFEWRSDDSPFDQYLRGEAALSDNAIAGMGLFYGPAGCSDCHSGAFQTDHQFHAMAMPQLGPGKAARFENHARDEGRMRVTGKLEDAYGFRTPSLRNVIATAPYGHAGSHGDLEAFLRFHVDAKAGLSTYTRAQAVLPPLNSASDWKALEDDAEVERIIGSATNYSRSLTDDEVIALIEFLDTLSDQIALEGRLGLPEDVPSGLPIDR